MGYYDAFALSGVGCTLKGTKFIIGMKTDRGENYSRFWHFKSQVIKSDYTSIKALLNVDTIFLCNLQILNYIITSVITLYRCTECAASEQTVELKWLMFGVARLCQSNHLNFKSALSSNSYNVLN